MFTFFSFVIAETSNTNAYHVVYEKQISFVTVISCYCDSLQTSYIFKF